MKELVYNGHVIGHQEEMLSLTDMWRAAGSPAKKDPYEWGRYAGREFIEFIAENLKPGSARNEKLPKNIWKTVRGGSKPGTSAHWQIGLAYAKYLSHEFHAWCNTVVRGAMEVMAKDRASRAASIEVRKGFVDTLSRHSVQAGREIAMATNVNYKALFRRTASQLRDAKGLSKNAKLRDNLSPIALGAIVLSEAMSADTIEKTDRQGYRECADVIRRCGEAVKKVVVNEIRNQQPPAAIQA